VKEIRQIVLEHLASISDEQFEEELRLANVHVEGGDLSQ